MLRLRYCFGEWRQSNYRVVQSEPPEYSKTVAAYDVSRRMYELD